MFFGWLCVRFGPGCVSSGGFDFALGQHAFPRLRLLAAWHRLAFSQLVLMLCRVSLHFLRKAYSRFGPAGILWGWGCFPARCQREFSLLCFVCSVTACVCSGGFAFASGQGAAPQVVFFLLSTSTHFLGWVHLLLGPSARFLRRVWVSFGSACVFSGRFALASGQGALPRVVLFPLRASVPFLGWACLLLGPSARFLRRACFLFRAFVRFLVRACFCFRSAWRFRGRGCFC